MKQEHIELELESKNLLLFILNKRKLIFKVTGVVTVLALVISLLMKPVYSSKAIVFPTATSSVSVGYASNTTDFGNENSAEQLIQVLHSSRLRLRLVNEFKLFKHYEIDTLSSDKNFKLNNEFGEHISFSRTKYGSIQIGVLDNNPITAAKIANKIVDLIDTVKNEIIKERMINSYNIIKRKIDFLEEDLALNLNQIDSLTSKGVVSIEERANLYTALAESNSANEKALILKSIEFNKEFGSKYDGLERMRNEKIVKISRYSDVFQQIESDLNTNYSHKFVVERALVSDHKASPKRLIIVLMAFFGTFIFMIFILLINEKITEFKKQF